MAASCADQCIGTLISFAKQVDQGSYRHYGFLERG